MEGYLCATEIMDLESV